MRVILFLLITVAAMYSGAAQAGRYDERNFAKLYERYAKSVADPLPWAGYWWPYVDNGIADGSYDTSELAPTDKIDRVFGLRNYASSWERARHGLGRRPADWWGHCNGWSTAAIMEREPREAVSRQGYTFGVADRKALLTEYWMESGSDFIGSRVSSPNDFSSRAFWDVSPAAFHLLLTNVVGAERQSVIIDRFTGSEVWNQPLAAYELAPVKPEDYLGPDPRYKNLYRVNVTATIWWVSDEVEGDAVTPPFEWKENDYFEKRTLRYELWLDAPVAFNDRGQMISSGNIVLTSGAGGGTWKNGTSREALENSHPDFIWIPLSYARSSGYKNPRIRDEWIKANLTN